MLRTFGAALLAAFLFPVAAVASTTTTPHRAPVVKIKLAASSGYAALKAAKAQGVFTKAGVDLTIVPMSSSKGVVQAVNAGGVQFGITDPTVAMWQGIQNNLSYKIVSGAEAYKAKSIGVFAGSGIASTSDLNQATIAAAEQGSVAALATDVWLDEAGADSSSVTWEYLPTSALAKALRSGATAVVAPAGLVKGKSLGDPIASTYGVGAPLAVAIANVNVGSAKIKKLIKALTGVRGFNVKLNMALLEAESETVSNYGLTENQPDLSALVWSGAPKS